MAKANTPAAPPSLGGSFKVANTIAARRMIMAVDGLDKQGKTHFALTAPGPIAYQSLDIGAEGVMEKFQTSKTIYAADYGLIIEKGESQESIMKKALPVWDQFFDDFQLALKRAAEGLVRTIVWDTGSELWELLRLARFGKLIQIMPHHYTALNSEYRNMVRAVYGTPTNMVILHKLKAEWKDNPATGKGSKTGAYERAGYADTAFLVQVNAGVYRNAEGFHLVVKNCRQNPDVADLDLCGDLCSFPNLGTFVYPDSTPEEWQ